MKQLKAVVVGAGTTVSITNLDDSINSHLVVYAAEESRKEEGTVRL